MERNLEIKPVVTKRKLSEKKTDAAYWRGQSYMVRMGALEEIRLEYHVWKYGTEPGFQRVYTIAKR